MTSAVTRGVPVELLLELDLARVDLVWARRAHSGEDDRAGRTRVARCRERIDALLDMWNDSGVCTSDRLEISRPEE
ncbi:hypothetical protein [Geodermatophilus maliterrae]|uniref:Uncharacterized protein n=1 Tax=Geodermatophilus maliterrae TaxID=3162531 RepID=A0ABV3XI51_9ACTN